MEGYAVELAVDGGEGLTKLTKASYDLVLLDLMLPDRSGMDVLADIRHARSGNADHHADGIRVGRSRRERDQSRRERLLLEALGQREAADRNRDHDREEPAGEREYASQARSEAALQFPEYRRQE